MLKFIAGVLIGAIIGFVVFAACIAGATGDRMTQTSNNEEGVHDANG